MKNKTTVSLSLRKLMLSALVAAPLATLPSPLWALPANQAALDAVVSSTSGATVTSTNANRVDVTASTTNSVVKWTEFGSGANTIGASDLINFALPSSSSSILNMVTGASASNINGRLESNGNLLVMNQNGITVGATGVITANSVTLSTVPETEYSFLASGQLQFTPNQSQNAATTGDITTIGGSTITAASGTGNVWIVAQDVNLAGTINAGNTTVTAQNAGVVVLGANANLTVGNTISQNATLTINSAGTTTLGDVDDNTNVIVYGPTVNITTGNASIIQAGNGLITIGGGGTANSTLTANAGTGNIILPRVVNNNGNTLTVNATAANVQVGSTTGHLAVGGTITNGLTASTAAGNLTLNAATVTGAVNATAVGGNILSGGNVTASGAVTLTADAGRHVTFAGKGSSLSLVGAGATRLGNASVTFTDNLALGAIAATNLTVSATGNITQSAAQDVSNNASITSTGGNITLTATLVAGNLTLATTGSSRNITQSAIAQLVVPGTITVNASGNATLDALTPATLNATAGNNLTLGGVVTTTGTTTLNAGNALAINANLTAPTLNATGKTIADGAVTITSTGTATLTGNTSITLDSPTNAFSTVVIKGAADGATVADANGVILGNATNAAGNVTIIASNGTAGDVQLGAAAGDVLNVTGALVIDNDAMGNGNITDASNNVTVSGNSTFIVGGTGVVTIDGATGNGLGLNHNFGQVNITTAGTNATIYEKNTLNLGAITLGASAGDLRAYSASGIINTARLQVNDILIGAGTAAAPGDIALTYTHDTNPGNSITGTVTLLDELELLTPGAVTVGDFLAGNVSITAATATGGATPLFEIIPNVFGNGITGTVTLTTTGGQALVAGRLATTGAVNLVSGTGGITANAANSTFTSVNVTTASTAASDIATGAANLTVTGVVSGTGTVAYHSAGNVTISNYTSRTTGATTFDAANSGAVTNSIDGLAITGDVTFDGGSVAITGSGHSFGGVTITTNGNGNATIVESGTLRLVSVNVGTGAFNAQSLNGNIIDSGVITAGNATFTASNGAVELDQANAVSGRVNITSNGNVTYVEGGAIVLGNVTTNGALTVTSAGTITQASGTAVYAFGATSLSSGGNNAITVGNTGNRFGGLTLNSGTAATTVREQTTVNLRSVTAGALTVTSDGGSIIDSGSGAVTVTGATSLTAASGDITLALANSNYGSVALSTNGNASLIDKGGDLVLAASTVGGNFTVTNSTGNISQTGALRIVGATTFNATSAGSSLVLNNTANEFGSLQFRVGTGGAVIDEVTTINLRGGSLATGAVVLNTAGNFVTSGAGASTFDQTLTINAIGTIIPGAGSLAVRNGLIVNSPSLKDLSGLSLSGNLFGVAPTNQGTGTYTPPTP